MGGLFTAEGAWLGGEYELTLELMYDDEVLLRALKRLWRHPDLAGCYRRMDLEPEDQSRLDPASADLPHLPALPLESYLCGVALLPNGCKAACRSDTLRQEGGADWLSFGVPMGSLGAAYPVRGTPLDDSQPFLRSPEVDDWLSRIGRWVFQEIRFGLGFVGWDVDGPRRARDLARDGPAAVADLGLLQPAEGRLDWLPPSAD